MAARFGQLGVIACLLLAGCGGPMQPEELGRSVETLSASAAEGVLLARGVAQDRTKTTFVRARAREIGETLDHESEKVSDATPSSGTADDKRHALDLANKISTAVGDIQTSPTDAKAARSAEQTLNKLADEATRLADSL